MVRETLVHSVPLNQRITAVLPPYVSFIVVPLFALANAGIPLSAEAMKTAFGSALTWGVIAGLVLGKIIGITGGAALVMKLSPKSKLPGLDLPRLLGVGALTGMGFTISLLVAGLALEAAGHQGQFCELHDALVHERGELSLATILERAEALGLDTAAIQSRVERFSDEAEIDDDALDGIESEGVLPVVFLQGERMPSALDAWQLARLVEDAYERLATEAR